MLWLPSSHTPDRSLALALVFGACVACGEEAEPERQWECVIPEGEDPDYVQQLGCDADFRLVASQPLDAAIPGARSTKTAVDRVDGNALYFQNSNKYAMHWDFASAHLSGNGLPVVPMLSSFNTTEYYAPSRRFLLGALTHYEGPDRFCYEIAPYDTASAEMIADAYRRIADNTYVGDRLYFHPTSQAIERESEHLPASVRVITTNELFEGVSYQALNLAESYGQLRFISATELAGDYVTFRDIAVLDQVPNDISVVMGIITGEFQTPLSHINVLSRNRGTPNMALRDAFDDPELRALEGKWVRLAVGAFDFELEEVSREEADAWWEQNKPSEVQVPGMDLAVTDLRDIQDTIDLVNLNLYDAIKAGTRAFGGKAAHFGALARIEGMPTPKAFAVPVYYYRQFMEQNGFDQQVAAMLADGQFQNDPAIRDARLSDLRGAMQAAPVDPSFQQLLLDKLGAEYAGIRLRFRSSTNAEDLEGFTGAGLYTSKSGDPNDPGRPVLDAVREVWASVWLFRAFEERSYRSIDHTAVGMALLVHRSFPDEEANGVALTANPFDQSGVDSAFYVNVQRGEVSVVHPPAGTTTDEYLHYYDRPDQPVRFITHSNLTADGQTVLTNGQMHELAVALDQIRTYFAPAHAPPADADNQWWAMDVEFKFDDEPGPVPVLYVKQARPYGQ